MGLRALGLGLAMQRLRRFRLARRLQIFASTGTFSRGSVPMAFRFLGKSVEYRGVLGRWVGDLQRHRNVQAGESFRGGAMTFCWIKAWLCVAFRFHRGFGLRAVCLPHINALLESLLGL